MTPEPLSVDWTPTARRALARLTEKVATAAVEFIYGGLAENPQRASKALRNELEGLHSVRRGSYRIIYRIGGQSITIMAIERRILLSPRPFPRPTGTMPICDRGQCMLLQYWHSAAVCLEPFLTRTLPVW